MDYNQNNLKPITDAMMEIVNDRPRLTPLERSIYWLVATGAFTTVGGLVNCLSNDESETDRKQILSALLELDDQGLAFMTVTVRTE